MLSRTMQITATQTFVGDDAFDAPYRSRQFLAAADDDRLRDAPGGPLTEEEEEEEEEDVEEDNDADDDAMPSPDVLPVPPDEDDADDLDSPHTSDADATQLLDRRPVRH